VRRCFRYQCDNVCTRREGMITFVNLCSYRLVFSKNLMKIGGLRVPLFLCVCPKGRGSTQKMSQINLLFLFSRTGRNASGRKNAGQKKARTSRANFMSKLIHRLTSLAKCSNNCSTVSAPTCAIKIALHNSGTTDQLLSMPIYNLPSFSFP